MPTAPTLFRPPGAATVQERKRDFDRKRGSARQRGYSGRWDKTSARYREAHPFCLGCQAMGLVEPTTLTDHIVPHKGDRQLFWDPENRQPSCDWHHNVVKQILELMFQVGEIGAESLRLDSPAALEVAWRELGAGPPAVGRKSHPQGGQKV